MGGKRRTENFKSPFFKKYHDLISSFLCFILGKSEFKGRSKRDTLAIRNKAQARKSESPLKVVSLSFNNAFIWNN